MIRHTEQISPQHTVVAYSDNAAVMEGGPRRSAGCRRASPTRRYTARATKSRMC
jgi:hypothetical protein